MDQEFLKAAKEGNLDTIKNILKSGKQNINCEDISREVSLWCFNFLNFDIAF